jgi:alkylhydroperoxidase/carboxymuconolactone decarboxylase family protein YurZ
MRSGRIRPSRAKTETRRAELIETITRLAFYAGWPEVITAIGIAEVLKKK